MTTAAEDVRDHLVQEYRWTWAELRDHLAEEHGLDREVYDRPGSPEIRRRYADLLHAGAHLLAELEQQGQQTGAGRDDPAGE